MKLFLVFLFLLFTGCILTNSRLSCFYAFMGLELWYNKMIPALLPFMILSGLMVRLKLTDGFTAIFYPLLKPLFKSSKNVCYAILMGFFCGFPMGARTVSEMYERHQLTKREAGFLLAFCNNIGPAYFIGFVLPLLQRSLVFPYLAGMYGIPLLYGIFLRHTVFCDIPLHGSTDRTPPAAAKENSLWKSLLTELDASIHSALQGILTLGGYMILFNLLNILPRLLFLQRSVYIAPLLEISGGMNLLQQQAPLYILLILPMGGLSCLAQTYSCIKNTDLSVADYIRHKLILTVLTAVYYLGWYFFSPTTFLR